MITLGADKEKDHPRFFPFRLVLIEHRAEETSQIALVTH
jgi:hypothetical protein